MSKEAIAWIITMIFLAPIVWVLVVILTEKNGG